MRLPSMQSDRWQLVSGEDRHAEAPATFEIPPLVERQGLAVGQAAKLIFEIADSRGSGASSITTERMWVIVLRREHDGYMGILENEPRTTSEGCYLQRGSEVPFLPMHVIAIDNPPADYVKNRLKTPPVRCWKD